MYDIIIVGAGPAGLTSALYALRGNKKVLVLEAKNYGGQILNANKIENYPGISSISGYDFATNLYEQVKNLGGEVRFETVVKVNDNRSVVTNKETYFGKSVILATGAENRKLNIENENKFIGKGVSYCATCDGNFFKGKVVAVNGGGNTALEDALYLSDIAESVYVIHRREEFRGENRYVEELKKKKNIIFLLNSTVTSLLGNEKLESIIVTDQNREETTLKVDALFIAIGQVPKNEIFKNVVDVDEKGYILSPDGVHTKTPFIYVAGDTRVKILRQLTTAVSDGSVAAVVAMKEINE